MIVRLLALLAAARLPAAASAQSRAEIERTMRRATEFMVEQVATRGGYVWSYLPDLSRRWGEMEAEPGMIWVQAPGTATMGHIFLDAYHATGDDYYYDAASAAGGRADRRPAPQRRLELFHPPRRAARGAALVRDGRPQRLAAGGIPALQRQCHVRRCRHRRDACSCCSGSIWCGTRRASAPRSTARSASCWRANIRAAAGRSVCRYDPRYPGLSALHHLQRRRRQGEYPLPDHGRPALGDGPSCSPRSRRGMDGVPGHPAAARRRRAGGCNMTCDLSASPAPAPTSRAPW